MQMRGIRSTLSYRRQRDKSLPDDKIAKGIKHFTLEKSIFMNTSREKIMYLTTCRRMAKEEFYVPFSTK
jgi:hypothetical protein